jgi:hypothetical protein
VAQLRQVQQQGEVPSGSWFQALYATPLQQLPAGSLADLAALLELLGQSHSSVDAAWVHELLQHSEPLIAGGSSSTRQLAAFTWALSQVRAAPGLELRLRRLCLLCLLCWQWSLAEQRRSPPLGRPTAARPPPQVDCELEAASLRGLSAAVLAGLQDFYAPDLAMALSALGALGAQLEEGQKQRVLEEVTFQVREGV